MEYLTVNCLPMRAKLTEYGCKRNQEIAEGAYNKLTDNGIYKLSDQEIHRLFCCGPCDLSCANIDMKIVKEKCISETKYWDKKITDFLEENPKNVFELPEDTYQIHLPEEGRDE